MTSEQISTDSEVDLGGNNILGIEWGATLGRGELSNSTTSGPGGIRNRIGYAGYQYDDAVTKYHVRNRVYDTIGDRWFR